MLSCGIAFKVLRGKLTVFLPMGVGNDNQVSVHSILRQELIVDGKCYGGTSFQHVAADEDFVIGVAKKE